MNLKEQLLETLRNELNAETASILDRNIEKKPIISTGVDYSYSKIKHHKRLFRTMEKAIYKIDSCESDNETSFPRYTFATGFFRITLSLVIIAVVGLLFYFGGKFVGDIFGLNLFLSILIEFGALITITFCIYLILKLIEYVYSTFENKIDSIKPKNIETKNDFDDDVYFIISSTYETLCVFRTERKRQAKISFNVALGLIIIGVLIIFAGVFLLFRKNIVEGVLSSAVGSVSNIVGGTIIKLYKDSNDRMDKLNADLSTLNTAKVQYAMILKMKDEKKRDIELSKLIKSIGNIKYK